MSRVLLLLVSFAGFSLAQLAVFGDRVYPVSGPPIDQGVVLIEGGKIQSVGPAAATIVPADWQRVRAKVVTPGLIDAHSVVGLAGYLNQPTDSDEIDRTTAMQPELRALDSYNPRERLVQWLRELGVTTLHTGHAPLALIPGQTMLTKTVEAPVDQTAFAGEAMVSLVFGQAGLGLEGKSPGNRAKAVALLRQKLIAAREYAEKRAEAEVSKHPARDLELEVLAEVLAQKRPFLVTAQRARDIQTALRLQDEFGFRMILDGAAEAPLLLETLKARGISIILHPTMIRASGEFENASMTTAARLAAAKIPFAFQSGYEGYVPKTRVVLFEAAVAVQHGLSPDAALRALTLTAAEILGVATRVGSLTAGKDADLACFDGDPFEPLTHCTTVIIAGQIVSALPR